MLVVWAEMAQIIIWRILLKEQVKSGVAEMKRIGYERKNIGQAVIDALFS